MGPGAVGDEEMVPLVPDHMCPLCQCAWPADGHAPTQWIALTENVKRMAKEILRLKKQKGQLR